MDQFDLLARAVKEKVTKWLGGLWGCSHRRTSFPITIGVGAKSETYVVCTLCGQRFTYDWATMSKTGRRQ